MNISRRSDFNISAETAAYTNKPNNSFDTNYSTRELISQNKISTASNLSINSTKQQETTPLSNLFDSITNSLISHATTDNILINDQSSNIKRTLSLSAAAPSTPTPTTSFSSLSSAITQQPSILSSLGTTTRMSFFQNANTLAIAANNTQKLLKRSLFATAKALAASQTSDGDYLMNSNNAEDGGYQLNKLSYQTTTSPTGFSNNNFNYNDDDYNQIQQQQQQQQQDESSTSSFLSDWSSEYWQRQPFPSGYTTSSITIIACLITIIIFLIVVGNVLVCIAIFTEKSLKPTQNWFIASLAVSDMLLGLVVMPFSLARELMGFWMFGPLWCDIHEAMDVLLTTASINTLCLISLDRYWSITQAVKYLKKRTPRRGAFMIAFVWIFSAAVSLPPLFGWKKQSPIITVAMNTSTASIRQQQQQQQHSITTTTSTTTTTEANYNSMSSFMRRRDLQEEARGGGGEEEEEGNNNSNSKQIRRIKKSAQLIERSELATPIAKYNYNYDYDYKQQHQIQNRLLMLHSKKKHLYNAHQNLFFKTNPSDKKINNFNTNNNNNERWFNKRSSDRPSNVIGDDLLMIQQEDQYETTIKPSSRKITDSNNNILMQPILLSATNTEYSSSNNQPFQQQQQQQQQKLDFQTTTTEYPSCQLSDDVGYVVYSALGSFYIPCAVMVFTYVKIFKAARSRARRAISKHKSKSCENNNNNPSNLAAGSKKGNNETIVNNNNNNTIGGNIQMNKRNENLASNNSRIAIVTPLVVDNNRDDLQHHNHHHHHHHHHNHPYSDNNNNNNENNQTAAERGMTTKGKIVLIERKKSIALMQQHQQQQQQQQQQQADNNNNNNNNTSSMDTTVEGQQQKNNIQSNGNSQLEQRQQLCSAAKNRNNHPELGENLVYNNNHENGSEENFVISCNEQETCTLTRSQAKQATSMSVLNSSGPVGGRGAGDNNNNNNNSTSVITINKRTITSAGELNMNRDTNEYESRKAAALLKAISQVGGTLKSSKEKSKSFSKDEECWQMMMSTDDEEEDNNNQDDNDDLLDDDEQHYDDSDNDNNRRVDIEAGQVKTKRDRRRRRKLSVSKSGDIIVNDDDDDENVPDIVIERRGTNITVASGKQVQHLSETDKTIDHIDSSINNNDESICLGTGYATNETCFMTIDEDSDMFDAQTGRTIMLVAGNTAAAAAVNRKQQQTKSTLIASAAVPNTDQNNDHNSNRTNQAASIMMTMLPPATNTLCGNSQLADNNNVNNNICDNAICRQKHAGAIGNTTTTTGNNTRSGSSYCGSSMTINDDYIDDCVDDDHDFTDECNGFSVSCGLDHYCTGVSTTCSHNCQECDQQAAEVHNNNIQITRHLSITEGSPAHKLSSGTKSNYNKNINQNNAATATTIHHHQHNSNNDNINNQQQQPPQHHHHHHHHHHHQHNNHEHNNANNNNNNNNQHQHRSFVGESEAEAQSMTVDDNLSLTEYRSNEEEEEEEEDSSSVIGHDILDATTPHRSFSDKKKSITGNAINLATNLISSSINKNATNNSNNNNNNNNNNYNNSNNNANNVDQQKKKSIGFRLTRLGSSAQATSPIGGLNNSSGAGLLLGLASNQSQQGQTSNPSGNRNLSSVRQALRQNFFLKLNQLTAGSMKLSADNQNQFGTKSKKQSSNNISSAGKSSAQSSGTSYEQSVDCATTSNVHSITDYPHETTALDNVTPPTTKSESDTQNKQLESNHGVGKQENNFLKQNQGQSSRLNDTHLQHRFSKKNSIPGTINNNKSNAIVDGSSSNQMSVAGGAGGAVIVGSGGGGRGSSRNNKSNTNASGGTGSGSRAYLASDNERHKRKLAQARERRATLILGLIMAAFICTWLPFFTFYVVRALCTFCRDYVSPRLEAFIFWAGYCNSAINPIIYTIFNRDFRKAFRKLLLCKR